MEQKLYNPRKHNKHPINDVAAWNSPQLRRAVA